MINEVLIFKNLCVWLFCLHVCLYTRGRSGGNEGRQGHEVPCDFSEQPCGSCEWNSGALEEQPVVLDTEACLQVINEVLV